MKSDTKDTSKTTNNNAAPLQEGVDYYINEQGYWVFTEAYHLKRGYCCESGCKHCPYKSHSK